MINFEDVHGVDTTDRPYFQHLVKEEENGDEDLDGCFHQPGKKRRLTADQVLYLERNFDMENKLEAERKVELAKDLGLQPRQVAIWYQNRRARFKTKQLEKDYDSLRTSYDTLKADYDCVFKENENLKNEVMLLIAHEFSVSQVVYNVFRKQFSVTKKGPSFFHCNFVFNLAHVCFHRFFCSKTNCFSKRRAPIQ